nr:hypothetical protein GCM10017745_40210 [Saccharothrix mutabilis subsp. capreolus]
MTRFQWGNDDLAAEFALTEDDVLRLERLSAPSAHHPDAPVPLVAVSATGHGRTWSGNRFIHTTIGERLRHKEHRSTHEDGLRTLTIELHDPETALTAEVVYRLADGIPVLRAEVLLRNDGPTALHLETVSSLAVGCLTEALDDAEVMWADNDWFAECRWRREPLRLSSPMISGRVRMGYGRGAFVLAGQGAWSSCGTLPMGGLTDRRTGRTYVWQVEHNGGGWRWECGEREGSAYLAAFGPCESPHGWRHTLEPGAEFRTVPVALAYGDQGPDQAFAAMTEHRRATRRPHPDHEQLPVIFNDYMNCLMGDPTTAKLLPLVDAAAEAGAEYFVIDAGWYADEAENWWDTVGAWEPSQTRFPEGSTRSWTTSGTRAWCPACGWSPRWSGRAARSPTPCPRRRSSAARACGSWKAAGTSSTCATPRPAPTSTGSWTGWSASGASATSSWTTTSTTGRHQRPPR